MNGISEKSRRNSSENGDICSPSTSESVKMTNSADKDKPEKLTEPSILDGENQPGSSKSAEIEREMNQNGPTFAQNADGGGPTVKWKEDGLKNKPKTGPKVSRRRKRRLSLLITDDDDESSTAKQVRSVSDNEEISAKRDKNARPNDPIVSPVIFHHRSHKRKSSESRKSRDSVEKRPKIDEFPQKTDNFSLKIDNFSQKTNESSQKVDNASLDKNELVQVEQSDKKFTEVTKKLTDGSKNLSELTKTEMAAEKSKIGNKTTLAAAQKPVNKDQEPKSTGIFNPSSQKFIYGNYNRYYGKRIPKDSDIQDPRFRFLKYDWFQGKTVLDVGCNIGLLTSHVAKHFKPRLITGIDIDPHLVGIARKNIKRYAASDDDEEVLENLGKKPKIQNITGENEPSTSKEKPIFKFPHNILFQRADYVPANDRMLDLVRPEYDVIIAFSITKWIHLNWGDDGLKRFFKRIYKNLNPGGILLLEPQAIASYHRRKKLTPEIYKTFKSIKFLPDQFNSYLISAEVGFESVKTVGVPMHRAKGFSRPIFMFKKAAGKVSDSSKTAKKTEKSQ